MNTIEKIYTNYDGLLEEFSEEVIQSRYAVFYEEIEEFAKRLGIREKIQISESLLSHAVLDYFTDISRLKHFHQAKHINSLKVISYETYWLLRRKPIQILVELVEMMQKGLSGFRRFLDVMETESEIRDADNAAELTDVKGHVRYDHVSFHYNDDETPVLSDISIDIPAGKSIALVGPSGSGKTTICSLLPRFYDVTGGSITVDGKDIRGLTLKSLRSQIGMVQQDVYLFDGTIKDNIAYGKPGASDEEIIKAAKCASIHDFIMELPDKYDTYVGERGTRLSGGQKQRISIARVFLKNPPILILDEATSALDNESERWIQKSLEELSKNRTTITIAHRLSTIRDADEIIVITEEGIAERGTHAELLEKNGLYAAYYNM